jgi:NAD+ synthase (glutamine-hydrolysing)
MGDMELSCVCCVPVVLQLVVRAIESGDKTVLADARRIGQYKDGESVEVSDLCGRLFHSVYMGTINSSSDTRSR